MAVTLEVVKELLEAHRGSFQWLMDDMKAEVKGLKKEFDDFKASIQFVSNENDSIKSTIKVAEENVKKLTKKLEVVEIDMYDSVEDMLNKQEYMENQSRRNNLKLIGVPEDPSEQTWDDTEKTVKALIKSELGINEDILIERAHRIGKPNHNPKKGRKDGWSNGNNEGPRHIVAKFQSWKVKEKVVQKAREVKPDSIKFVNDFSRRTMEKRSSQIQDMIKARKAGKVAYFVNGSKLVIKDRQPSNYVHRQNVTKQHEKSPVKPTSSTLDGSSEGDDEVVFKES